MIGRNTAFTYKGKPVDLKQIGRELNVRYVLEGSVQRGATACASMCSSSTPRPAIISGPSDSISRPPTSSTCRTKSSPAWQARSTPLAAAEARRAEQTPTPNSMDLYFQGLAWYMGLTPTIWRKRAAFSIARLPSIPAISRRSSDRRARTLSQAYFCLSPIRRGLLRGRSEVDQSLVVGSGPPASTFELGIFDYTPSALPRASPNANMLWRWIETLPTLMQLSDSVRSLSVAPKKQRLSAEALRLSPRDTMAYVWMTFAGMAKLHLGGYEQAVAWFRRAIEANRNYPLAHFPWPPPSRTWSTGRGAFRGQGRLALNPAFTISRARTLWTAPSDIRRFWPSLSPF